ncbi:glycosyltransferase family A protein [Fibrobacter sp. UWB13]|uniref:glycosyltransferase family 2 protein n=1 Tax=Fibrobacter sp. UWB13 TaxID=1896204 RepID=UPI000A0BFA0A|nr:glycosyltransferase family A protein [Fibrobacter sp. UWB13]SMG10235.1 Glycosyltransferase involved in cell wall bisynthesis [Fibrobacter sp. UWB13]
MDNSLVSIIVPVYNTAEYVEECVQSVLSQSYKNIELILVNDGSTDGSGDICKKYENRPNVIYIEQDNLGTTAARRRGVEKSHGEWIMFVDSDDILLDNGLEYMVELSEKTNIVLSGHTHNINLIQKLPDIISKDEYLKMIYTRDIYVAPFGRLFHKSLFNERTLAFPRYYVLGEDYLMNLQIAIDNKEDIRVYKQSMYYRRYNPLSTMHINSLTFDYCQKICGLADNMVMGVWGNRFPLLQMKQRMVFFNLTLKDVRYHSDSHHPFVKDIKRYMDESGVWRPMDRWLLSVSSPWAVKTVWNLRKVWMRLEHPSMFLRDLKKWLGWCIYLILWTRQGTAGKDFFKK